MTVNDAIQKTVAGLRAQDWREALKWEGRMEEMMVGEPDATCCDIIIVAFIRAHKLGSAATGSVDHMLSLVGLYKRRVELLGKMQRFRDQGEDMWSCAHTLMALGRDRLPTVDPRLDEAATYFQMARNLAEKHGFFSVESRSCQGLGELAMIDGRHEEGLDCCEMR